MEGRDLCDCLYVQAGQSQNFAQTIESLERVTRNESAQFIPEERLVLLRFFLAPEEGSEAGPRLRV